MTDRAAVALAALAALGAYLGGGPGPVAGALLALVAVASRRPWLLCLAAALLAAGLADRARAGLDPAAAGSWSGWATLVSDPEPLDSGGVSVVLTVDGRRVEAAAHGPPAWVLEPRLSGERIYVEGRLRPPPLPLSSWRVQRRIVGRLDVDDILDASGGAPLAEGANALRRAIDRGASGLPDSARSLLAGVVLGDDRRQPPELADDFRAAGLTHLLAVSGQNLVFVLALARPILAWLPGRARLVATLGVLGAFAALVRFEPSVLRASAMAAVACIAATLGRPAERIRVLALAVAALLVVDPLLVRSIGFGLSVGASLGIVVLAPRLAAAIPGPPALAEALAVTIAAQAGAAPVLLPAFGAVPVATIPANLLAVPAAGPLMTWGLTGGVIAGIVGGTTADVLHLPSRALTWWLATVANRCARMPLGELRAAHVVVLGTAAVLVAARRRLGGARAAPAVGAVMAGAVVLAAALAVPTLPAGHHDVVAGVATQRAGSVTVVVMGDGARPRDALEELRRAGAFCVDAIVVDGGSGLTVRHAASALARRCAGVTVLAPAGEALPGWRPITPGSSVALGAVVVAVDDDGRVQVGSLGHGAAGHAPAPRAPPVRHHLPRRRHGHLEPHA